MKLKLTGLILILIGFAAPFVLQKIFPTFLYAAVISTLNFWIGFILILSPIHKKSELSPYLKWARYAILFNIVWTLVFAGYLHLMNYFELLHGTEYYTLKIFEFIANPIGNIYDLFVPKPMVQLPNGSVQVTHSFVRMLLTTFFSLIVYSIVGMVVKRIKDGRITAL